MTSTSTANSAVPGCVELPADDGFEHADEQAPDDRAPDGVESADHRAARAHAAENCVIANGVRPPNAGPSSAAASPASAPAAIHAKR